MSKDKMDLLKDIKVTPIIKVDEIIQVDGGFFYIAKSTIKDSVNRGYDLYRLKRVVSPKKMRIAKKLLNLK